MKLVPRVFRSKLTVRFKNNNTLKIWRKVTCHYQIRIRQFNQDMQTRENRIRSMINEVLINFLAIYRRLRLGVDRKDSTVKVDRRSMFDRKVDWGWVISKLKRSLSLSPSLSLSLSVSLSLSPQSIAFWQVIHGQTIKMTVHKISSRGPNKIRRTCHSREGEENIEQQTSCSKGDKRKLWTSTGLRWSYNLTL